jgi:hypothetical protein
MTLRITIKRFFCNLTHQMLYRAIPENNLTEWLGDGVSGNRRDAIWQCFQKYQAQGFNHYYLTN